MIEAKSSILQPKDNFNNYFVARNTIVPVTTLDYNSILEQPVESEFFTEQEISEKVKEKESTPEFKKFFSRIFDYVNNFEDFLNTLKTNTFKLITGKKISLQTEKTDQQIKRYHSKRLLNQYEQTENEEEESTVNLTDNPELSGKIAAALGLGVAAATGMAALQPGQIPSVHYEPVSGQLVPKGTSGVSGYPLTSSFGSRWGKTHGGVDVGVPVGTMFAVKAKSQVVFAGWQNPQDQKEGYGLLVDVWIPTIKQMIRFAHLSSVAVKVGDQLEAGKVLGKSGNTGYSTGPHFHIESHDTITPAYSSKDPTPHLGYVILGDTIQQRSEGAVERVGRIMVGEADPEFVIPMSQMPKFAQAMIEEKIKCLNPYYNGTVDDNLGVSVSNGSYDEAYSAGAIVMAGKVIKHHEALSSFTRGSNDYIKPGGVSVGPSETKWNDVVANPNKNIIHPYQNAGDPGGATIGWGSIYYFDQGTKKVQISDPPISLSRSNKLLDLYINKELVQNYSKKFTFWNSFSDSQKASLISLGYNMGANWLNGTNFFRLLQAGKVRDAAREIPNDIPDRRADERRMLLNGPHILLGTKIVGPKVVGPAKVGSGIPFFPDLKIKEIFKQSSLNNIDQSVQMEIAKETQNKFSFEGATNEIIAFYKPTVYYPEEVS